MRFVNGDRISSHLRRGVLIGNTGKHHVVHETSEDQENAKADNEEGKIAFHRAKSVNTRRSATNTGENKRSLPTRLRRPWRSLDRR